MDIEEKPAGCTTQDEEGHYVIIKIQKKMDDFVDIMLKRQTLWREVP